ncbi:MAG: hypothetical protein NC818_00980 [Candidatus Omnitrophica bacterium]|nr:hypothetical protein [Candidatus Omnitrophota bacterium]
MAKKCGVKKTVGSKKKVQYVCELCGLVITVDNPCSCDACDVICCGEAMKPKK